MRISHKFIGVWCMVAAVLTQSLMQALVGVLGGSFGIWELVFYRSVAICFVAGSYILYKRGSLFGTRHQQPILLVRSLTGTAAAFFLFYASAYGAQADVAILYRLNPFFVAILAVLFLKERPGKMLVPALLVAFLGSWIAARPALDSNFVPMLAAVLAGAVGAVAYTTLSYQKDKADGMTVVFHFAFVSGLCMLPFAMQQFHAPTAPQLLLLLAMGLNAAATQITLTYAYRFAPAAEVSVFSYVGIVFSVLFGYMLLGEPVSVTSALGGGIVVLAALLMYMDGWRAERLQHKAPPPQTEEEAQTEEAAP